MKIKDKNILALLTYFIHSSPRRKRIPKPARVPPQPPPAGGILDLLKNKIIFRISHKIYYQIVRSDHTFFL